jgi:hypothetical protein
MGFTAALQPMVGPSFITWSIVIGLLPYLLFFLSFVKNNNLPSIFIHGNFFNLAIAVDY